LICNIPKVTVTTWSAKNVILAGPTYKQYLSKSLEVIKNKDIASIIGQPGMGKTTILKKVEEIISKEKFTLFLDLSSKGEIESEFWDKIDRFMVKNLVVGKMDRKKYKYGFLKKLTGVSFENHLYSMCGKLDDFLLRLYCLDYSRDFDGILKFVNDLKNVMDITILVDEIREGHLSKIHRLINSGLNVPILMAIPTDAYNKVTDLAIRRRLDESRISLDSALTSDDIKEIVEAYCKPISDVLFPIILAMWNGRELTTVSSILQFIKSEVERIETDCEGNVECIKDSIQSSYTLKNVEENSTTLEKMLRETISSLSKEFRVSYVHQRGKRVEVKGKNITVGIFFTKDDYGYLGIVKLSNGNEISGDEISLLPYVEQVENDKKIYKIRKKFIITNTKINVQGVDVVEIPTLEVIRIIRGDSLILEERTRSILKELVSDDQTTNVQNNFNAVATT